MDGNSNDITSSSKMIELETIKNTDTRPYIFGVRGAYLPRLLMIGLFVFILGFVIMLTLVFTKQYAFAFMVFLLVIFFLFLVFYYFQKLSKSPPFKGLKTQADFITHINFKRISKNGN